MKDILSLVGAPYAFPSDPPRSFDCWSLVKYVRQLRDLPCPLPFSDSETWCVPGNLHLATARARGLWTAREAPRPYDMAVLEPAHVGVVVDGGVLHALSRNSSVVLTSFAMVRRAWPKAEWWSA